MNAVFVFIGTSCSGKSALSKRFAQSFGLQRIDVADFVLPYLAAKDAGKMSTQEMLDIAYREFFDALRKETYDVIEIASDDPEVHLPAIRTILKLRQRRIVLVFTDASFDECLARNSVRPQHLQVPYEVLEHQAQYDRAFFLNLRNQLDCMLMFIDTSSARDSDQSYAQFMWAYGKFKRFGLL